MVAFTSSVPVSGQHRTELPLQMNLLPWGTFRLLRWGGGRWEAHHCALTSSKAIRVDCGLPNPVPCSAPGILPVAGRGGGRSAGTSCGQLPSLGH